MKKVIAILVLAFGFSFADDFDNDRVIPTFNITIPKGDTNFSSNRQSEVRKITFNDSSVIVDKKVEKNPTFKISQVNIITQSTTQYGME